MELELLVFMIVIIGSYTGVDPRIAHSLNVSVFCSVKCSRYSSKICTPDRTRIQKFWRRYLPYQRFFFGRGWGEWVVWGILMIAEGPNAYYRLRFHLYLIIPTFFREDLNIRDPSGSAHVFKKIMQQTFFVWHIFITF